MTTVRLTFTCPSCGTKLAPVTAWTSATQVVRRTCRNRECRERWQLVIRVVAAREGFRIDAADFTFLGRVK